ncbi:MAG TPA: hypothetical protein DEQ43_04940 [Nocardioides bacterium]|mgnify:CR=1 FL=1|jgi:hypothetical protein|nr:hypothetical protein [Nocardioides sp.]
MDHDIPRRRLAARAAIWAGWAIVDAAATWPRATIVAYTLVWALLDVPLWVSGGGWWNAVVVAVNPLTWAVLWVAADIDDEGDDDVPVITSLGAPEAIWQTSIASERTVHLS